MITFEESKDKALKQNPKFNTCVEYENGFYFCFESTVQTITYGGELAPCVILKESGKAIPMPTFVMQGTGEEIKKIRF